ncbi:VOC family protein [Actinomadura parmotrematis]|uniref:VOC family protein n=1 Tax=Actinomadura parmotrematis TaxID=2864039 RepID=A0ABS7G0A2_9ACTN|nr:VOC family protein [Actinomadura parmotrematis]MBW8486122.1 VOC family protein [Actinomadura parmotrematis]
MTRRTVYPILGYADPIAAIAWLEKAFGFASREVHTDGQGRVVHAEIEADGGLVMIGCRPEAGGEVYVAVDDPDAHHDRARAAGAEITRPPHDTDYGSRDYSARDLEGHAWHFGTYRP